MRRVFRANLPSVLLYMALVCAAVMAISAMNLLRGGELTFGFLLGNTMGYVLILPGILMMLLTPNLVTQGLSMGATRRGIALALPALGGFITAGLMAVALALGNGVCMAALGRSMLWDATALDKKLVCLFLAASWAVTALCTLVGLAGLRYGRVGWVLGFVGLFVLLTAGVAGLILMDEASAESAVGVLAWPLPALAALCLALSAAVVGVCTAASAALLRRAVVK